MKATHDCGNARRWCIVSGVCFLDKALTHRVEFIVCSVNAVLHAPMDINLLTQAPRFKRWLTPLIRMSP